MPSRALTCVAACLAVGVGLLGGPAAGSPAPDTGGTLVRPVAGGACPDFPADNWWHADIRGLPVHARSDAWLRHMSPSSRLHPDFGDSFGAQPVPYGIPITVVGAGHDRVRVRFQYASESRPRALPARRRHPHRGRQERRRRRHAVIVDRSSCRLYELFNTRKVDGRWRAGSGAVWDLRSNQLRPRGWTSADAAGLPILPDSCVWVRCAPVGSTTPSVSPRTSPTDGSCGPRATRPGA